MKHLTVFALAFAILLGAPAMDALAQGKSKDKGNKGKNKGGDVEVSVPLGNTDVTVKAPGLPVTGLPLITSTDIGIIRNFYNNNPGAFGAVKPIPPGIQKNMARGKPMPPGIQKTRFPNGLLSQLPNYPGYEWTLLGNNDIALVAAATNVIVDLFQNSF